MVMGHGLMAGTILDSEKESGLKRLKGVSSLASRDAARAFRTGSNVDSSYIATKRTVATYAAPAGMDL